MACLAKHKWGLRGPIYVVKFRNATFTIGFQLTGDFLKMADRTWENLGDVPMMIRMEAPKIVREEVYNWIPQ